MPAHGAGQAPAGLALVKRKAGQASEFCDRFGPKNCISETIFRRRISTVRGHFCHYRRNPAAIPPSRCPFSGARRIEEGTMMTMLKPALVPSLACAAFLAFASHAQAQTAQSQPAQVGHPGVSQRTQAGRQVIEIDMAALADPAPRRAPARLAEAPGTTPVPAEPAPGGQPRKRIAKRVGLYGDASLMAQLGWAH
jgi:hypothetical protein